MRVLVPFDSRDPNTRLSAVLDSTERREFANVLLDGVVETVQAAGHAPTVLATESIDADCPVRVDERPLSPAINAVLAARSGPVAVVMSDLALATVDALGALFEPAADVVLAPGLGGGTNAIVIRDTAFRVDYHGGSYRKHRREADRCGAAVETVDSFRLAVDIDEPADLVELLIHGDGEAAGWLREAGFDLDTTDGRCVIRRDQSSDGVDR
jgi:2-phospho-L-lactate guanylyltransferase